MRNVIQVVLEAEAAAAREVAAARAQAERLVAEARRECGTMLEQAGLRAREAAEAEVAGAVKVAEARRTERLQQVERESEVRAAEDEKWVAWWTDQVVRRVVGVERETGGREWPPRST